MSELPGYKAPSKDEGSDDLPTITKEVKTSKKIINDGKGGKMEILINAETKGPLGF